MSDHPRLGHLRTTTHILKQTTLSFTSNTSSLLLLSLVLLSFRTLVENGSQLLTSYIDRDPSLKSLLSRLDLAGNNRHGGIHPHPHPHHPHHHHPYLRRRRRPFLHLTRVGTLDDDFFSDSDDDHHRSPFYSHRRSQNPNSTVLMLSNFSPHLGFSPNVVDNGVRLDQVLRNGVKFRVQEMEREEIPVKEVELDDKEEIESEKGRDGNEDIDKVFDMQFFVKGLELGRRDAAAFLFLVCFLSTAYGWVIIGFLATYSCVLGSVFVVVSNDLLGRFNSLVGVLWDGSKLGVRRLSGFILMRWAVRDALTQLLGLWFFGEIEDQYTFFKLFVRLKLMPFSVMLPWSRGFEKEISGFLFAWFAFDMFLSYVFAVDAWIAVVDSRKSGREIVMEGCYLILNMTNQAAQLKCLEAVFCGSSMRWALARIGGKVFAGFFQCTMEVYFMIAWLFFYFATRCKDAELERRRFEIRELEAAVQAQR